MPVRRLSDSETYDDVCDDEIEWPIPGITVVGVKLTYLIDAGRIHVSLDPEIYRRPQPKPVTVLETQPIESPPGSPTPTSRRRLPHAKRLRRSRALAEFEARKKHRPCIMSPEPRPRFL